MSSENSSDDFVPQRKRKSTKSTNEAPKRQKTLASASKLKTTTAPAKKSFVPGMLMVVTFVYFLYLLSSNCYFFDNLLMLLVFFPFCLSLASSAPQPGRKYNDCRFPCPHCRTELPARKWTHPTKPNLYRVDVQAPTGIFCMSVKEH